MDMTGRRRTQIFILLYLMYSSIYIARLNLSVSSPALIAALVADKEQIGVLGSVFSVAYACGRILNGSLADRVAPYRMICSGLLLIAVSSVVYSFFPPYAALLLLWGINGYGQSMLWSSVLRILSEIYPPEEAKRRSTHMAGAVATGNILGILVSTAVLQWLPLRFVFLLPGMISFLMAFAVLSLTKDIPVPPAPQKRHLPMWKLLTKKEVLVALVPAMFQGAMKDNVSLWMTLFFVEKFGIDLARSSGFVLLIPVVGLVGRTLYPVLFRLTKERENIVMAIAFLLCGVCAVPLTAGVPLPVAATVCLSGIYAAASIANTSIVGIFPLHFADTGNVASVSGIMDFAAYGGAAIATAVYGSVIALFGYETMFASWIGLSAVAVAVSFVLTAMTARRKNQ